MHLRTTTRMTVPFYDQHGVRHMLGSRQGHFLESWTLGEGISRHQQDFVESVEQILCGVVVAAKLRGQNTNQTYEIVIEGCESFIAKKPLKRHTKDVDRRAADLQATSEANLLTWLKAHAPTLPVPHVLYSSPRFSVFSRLRGTDLADCFGNLDAHQKEALIISYAHISVELFHLQVPQRMGSTARAKAHDSITINPRIGAPPAAQADRVYDTLHDLLEYFFASSRAAALQCCASDAEKMETKRLYHVLQKHATSAASRLPPRTLVCALSHDALDESNILIDEHTGAVTGVIDWEFHSVVPRCLAARHPGWLRYDGVHDPRFARRDQYGTAWWLETREESARLTSLFEQVVRSRSEEFYEALIAGKTLRVIVEWLLEGVDRDRPCERMRRWMHASGLV